MKLWRVLAIYAVAVLTVGLALSWPTMWLFQHFGIFKQKEWVNFFSRCATLVAVAGLPAVLRALDMASLEAIGLRASWKSATSRAVVGWILAFAAVMALGSTSVAAGYRVWDVAPLPGFWKPLITGLVVGAFEELFFRGVIFGALRRHWQPIAALWASSFFYAALHFIPARPSTLAGAIPALASLTLFGVVLAWSYYKSGSLYLPMGIHAGCVAALKWWGAMTDSGQPGLEWLFGSGRFKLVNGAAAIPMLLCLWLALLVFEKYMHRQCGRR